jgi:hypothetical protein
VKVHPKPPLVAQKLLMTMESPSKQYQQPTPPPDHTSSPHPTASLPSTQLCTCSRVNFDRNCQVCAVGSESARLLPPSLDKNVPRPAQSSDSNFSSKSQETKTKPADIDIIDRAMRAQAPILIIISRSSPLLPFNLPDECSYSFLGYWIIGEMVVCLLSYVHAG